MTGKRRRHAIGAAVAFIAGVIAASQAAGAETQAFVRGSWSWIRAAHAGRPMIVHIWGLSCGPCLAELPEWGRFALRQTGVDVVLINADRDQHRTAAAEHLAKAGLSGAESWAFSEPHAARLRFEIDPSWQGEMPYTLLIGRDGAMSTFSGSADFSAVSGWADAAANAGAPK